LNSPFHKEKDYTDLTKISTIRGKSQTVANRVKL
jgi:hypothetical protein